jgi:hypothetical protein
MNPPRIALYSRYAVFGMRRLLRVLGDARFDHSRLDRRNRLRNRNVASNLTAQARPAEHYGKETII